ncbi:MAG: hypothetical protein OXC69_10750 [Candidatus Tectomicrobia bacterium]|nr:hypothetical protein [Candidatus Tectomicrobia bacterium]
MKQLAIAFFLVSGVAVISYLVLIHFSLSVHEASMISAVFLALTGPVHQTLKERSNRPRFTTEPTTPVTLAAYALPWHLLYVYGTLIFLAVTSLLSGFGGFLAAAAGIGRNAFPVILTITGGLGGLFVAFLLGRWVGLRSGASPTSGVLITMVALATALSVEKAFSFIVMPEDLFLQIYVAEPTPQLLLKGIAGGLLLYGIFGLLGYWRGRTIRAGNYLHFLLKRLPEETRRSLMALVYEEVQNVRLPPVG